MRSTRNSVYFVISRGSYFLKMVCRFCNASPTERWNLRSLPLGLGRLCDCLLCGMRCRGVARGGANAASGLRSSGGSCPGPGCAIASYPEPPCENSDSPGAAMCRGHGQAFQPTLPGETSLPTHDCQVAHRTDKGH